MKEHYTEAELKGKLTKHLRSPLVLPGFVIFRHEDGITAGHPDMTVNGRKMTTWLEVKHAAPRIRKRGVQTIKIRWLAKAAHAYYVIYYENGTGRKETVIIDPSGLDNDEWMTTGGKRAPGFDHEHVARFIRETHTL